MISKVMAEVMARLALGRAPVRPGSGPDLQDEEHRALYSEAALGRVWPSTHLGTKALRQPGQGWLRRWLAGLQPDPPISEEMPDPRISALVAQLRQSVETLPPARPAVDRQTDEIRTTSVRTRAGEPDKAASASRPSSAARP